MSYDVNNVDYVVENEWGDWREFFEDLAWKDKVLDLPSIGQARYVDNFGGEGEGDQYWFVFSVTDADGETRFFRRDGYYASFYGGYYDGPTEEVEQVEKTIKVWVKKK